MERLQLPEPKDGFIYRQSGRNLSCIQDIPYANKPYVHKPYVHKPYNHKPCVHSSFRTVHFSSQILSAQIQWLSVHRLQHGSVLRGPMLKLPRVKKSHRVEGIQAPPCGRGAAFSLHGTLPQLKHRRLVFENANACCCPYAISSRVGAPSRRVGEPQRCVQSGRWGPSSLGP